MKHGYCDDGDLDLESLLGVRKPKLTSKAVKAAYSVYVQRQRQRAIWEYQSDEGARLVDEYIEDKTIKEIISTWR